MSARHGVFVAVATAILVATQTGSRAQSTTSESAEVHTEYGLHRAVFQVPEGTIRVNYPDDMSVGDIVTGTVDTEPAGRKQQRQHQNRAALSGYVIEMEGQKTYASVNHFQWRVPTYVQEGRSPVYLRDSRGGIVAHCVIPVYPLAAPSDGDGFEIPLGGVAGTFVSALVPTSRQLGSSVSIGGQNAPLIAESPRKIVFLAPQGVVGPSTLQITKDGASAHGPYRAWSLQLISTRRRLVVGQTATVTAVVSGLQGSEESTLIVIANQSPNVVVLDGGSVQQITVQPRETLPNGTYRLTRKVTSLMGGGYEISVAVTRPPSSHWPIHRLAERAIDRWSRMTNTSVAADARIMIESGIDEARPEVDAFLQEQIAFHADAISLFDWMVGDYCFDLRDRKLRISTGLRPVSQRLGFANSFLQQCSGVPASADIEASNVRGFSFKQYLSQLLARLTPSQPVGDLTVTSQPPNQSFTIDSITGDNYFTTRSLVVSLGKHSVGVESCKKVVIIEARTRAIVNCP
jgi:hypothetical protein